MSKKEELIKAIQGQSMVRDNLMECGKVSNAVEGILILDLIRKSAELENEIKTFLNAVDCDDK